MHVLFIPYGKRSEVELLLRDMEAQKHKLLLTKGNKKKHIWVQGAVRQLPFGVYEYIFPKEDLDKVLGSLWFDLEDRYELGWFKLTMLKKMLRVGKIPNFKKERFYLWIKDHVTIIPLGIREDGYFTYDKNHEYAGWTQEAL